MESFDLALPRPARPACRLVVGTGALDALVDDVVRKPPGRLFVVVSDSNVAPLHGRPLERRLTGRGLSAALLEFPAGESNKNRATKASLEDGLLRLGAGRDTAILAVGGGVTGDLAGFVASTWHRGVPVLQVPTTLLAMVDAAVGGKTGLNLSGGKNLVGSYHQPLGVYADIATLATLPQPDYLGGFAEVVKSAAIADAGFFGWLESSAGALVERDRDAVSQAVVRCMRIKAAVVRGDERESGRRAVLNFGHTVAHALERATNFRVGHGAAVAVGLCVEGRIAIEETGFSERACSRLERLLEKFGLPVRVPAGVSAEAIIEGARLDKKTRDGRIHLALPRRIGRMLPGAAVSRIVAEPALVRAISRSRDGAR